MDRRSFLLTSLLPVIAAKQGVLGLPGLPPYPGILKARSIGMSTLIHAKMVAAYENMSRRLAQDLYFNA